MDDIESQMAASGHLRRLAGVAVEQFQRGDLNAAKRTFGELEASSRAAGNGLKLQEVLMYEGLILMDFDHVRARAVFKESVEIARKLEAKEELALALLKEAECLDFDEVHEALRLCEEGRSFAMEVGSEDLVRRIEQLLDCVRHFTKQAGQP
jgi:hypothetical protein